MRRISIVLLVASSCLYSHTSSALAKDSTNIIKLYEDTLKQLQFGRLDVHKTDKQKEEINSRFRTLLQKALSIPNSFDYSFDSLVTIARLESPDKKFRIINWNMPKEDGTQEYFGFIQSLNSKTKKYVLFPLTDKSDELGDAQSKTLTTDKWLGMLYYKIVVEKVDKNPQYLLLAWKGYNKLINKKIIEVISFSTEGVPSFGKAIFNHLPSPFKGSPKRIIFQYSTNVSMVLHYDAKKDMILFDHLGPMQDGLEGQYQYYGPSFQIDGLAFKDGKWDFVENVDARNSNHGDNNFHDPE
ncbi:MAG TPA: hypothetical protein VN922_00325, partial [Bacteroidia bacterium]|nr:hypothetical protein [Bacteroidia bacterium]